MTEPGIVVVGADEVRWDDLQTVLGSRGIAHRCQCQRYKLSRGESFASTVPEELATRLREQVTCGDGGPATTSGLIAYRDDEPVGWCALAPRPAFTGLVRFGRVPWEGRDEDRSDPTVWALTCLFTRAGYRRRGVGRALARAAVAWASEHGAVALEAYPLTTTVSIAEELHVGTLATFTAAGFTEVGRPTPRRAVVRINFS